MNKDNKRIYEICDIFLEVEVVKEGEKCVVLLLYFDFFVGILFVLNKLFYFI